MVVEQITKARGQAKAIRADVRQAAEITRLAAEAAAAFGPLDILVNNAGWLVERQPLAQVTEATWDEILNLNLKSALLCSQAVGAGMIERKRGTIINIVSIAGRNGGGPGAGAYATAKGGLIALTKAQAKEMAAYNVRCECGFAGRD